MRHHANQLILYAVFAGAVLGQSIILPGTTTLVKTTKFGALSIIPGFISETGQNSMLTIPLGVHSGTATIPASTCPDYSYCLNYADSTLTGNLGIVPFLYANTSASTPTTATASDGVSNGYTCITGAEHTDNSIDYWNGLCYAPNLIAGAHQVALTFGTTAVTQVNANAATFYNISTSSPLRTSNTAIGTSSTTMTGPTVATVVNDLVYAYFCRTGTPVMTSGSFAPGSGYTLGIPKYQDGCASEFIVSAGGNITPTMTMGSASTYIVFAAVFISGTGGTIPTPPYLQRFSSWSSNGTVSTANFKLQFPNAFGNELVMTEAGAFNYEANSITDSGLNTWLLAGQCVQTGTCASSGGVSSEFYVDAASANSTATQTVNFSGTGDCTINFYEFVGVTGFTNRTQFASNATTTNLIPATAFSFTPNATGPLVVATGPIGFDTALGPSSPVTVYFDGGFFGSETINGGGSPISILGQNNIWTHSYQNNVTGAQNWQWTLAANTSQSNVVGVDLLSFATASGIGIIQNATAQGTSGSTLAVTVPKTRAGDLLVVSTGFYDGATVVHVVSVCTDGGTCAAGNSFTQVPSAASTNIASTLLGTDVWYLAASKAGVTAVTVTYSATISGGNTEAYYIEVNKGSGAAWTALTGAHVNNGASCTTSCTGASVTPTLAPNVCVGHIATGGTGITANPKSGNLFVYDPTPLTPTTGFFASGGAATSVLTLTAVSTTPVWTAAAGAINESTACFQ